MFQCHCFKPIAGSNFFKLRQKKVKTVPAWLLFKPCGAGDQAKQVPAMALFQASCIVFLWFLRQGCAPGKQCLGVIQGRLINQGFFQITSTGFQMVQASFKPSCPGFLLNTSLPSFISTLIMLISFPSFFEQCFPHRCSIFHVFLPFLLFCLSFLFHFLLLLFLCKPFLFFLFLCFCSLLLLL